MEQHTQGRAEPTAAQKAYSLSFWSCFAACIKFSAAMATHLFAVALAKLMLPELH